MPSMTDRTALLRPVPDSFHQAQVREGKPEIDVTLARAQHDEYRRQLEKAGHFIEVVSTDEDHPDCVFIEDAAAIVGGVAVIARSGATTRRGETGPVAHALSDRYPTTEITDPGTLDGGDVFTLGDVVYVGRSSRTNSEGISQLRAVAHRQGFGVVTVDVHDVLHLKSAVLPIDEETVVVTPGSVDEDRLDGIRVIYEKDAERHRFSALPLGDGRVMVTANAPATAESVSALGYEMVMIDVSQIQAADGGLTCMSIFL